jgi:hypothetical protein
MSLVILAPFLGWSSLGALTVAAGVVGLAYSGMTWADVVRDGLTDKMDWDDRLWYALGPVTGYAIEVVAGAALMLRWRAGCPVLAVAMGTLLPVSIQNA